MEQRETNTEEKKKKRFNLFDWYYRQGKGSDKNDINALKTPNFPTFFKLLWSKFGKLLGANLIFVFGNFPLFFLLLALSGWFNKTSAVPTSVTWSSFLENIKLPFFNGETLVPDNANYASSALMGIHGLHAEMTVTGIITYILFGLSLLTAFTWGFTKVGTTYLYRNMMSGEPVFPLSDFFYIVKRNIKQSLLFGAIDFILIAVLISDVVFLYNNIANPISLFMLILTLAMSAFYSFMRPYVYLMIFTFDLKFIQIIKNAAAFTILGIKRNLVGFGISLLIVILNAGLIVLPLVTPVGLLLPFVFTFALLDFIGVYVAYPNIIKYMMDEKDAKAIIERKYYDSDEIGDEPTDDCDTLSEKENEN